MPNKKAEHYFLAIPARNREHAEALLKDLLLLHKRIGWPAPILVPVLVDPTLPPGTPPIIESITWEDAP